MEYWQPILNWLLVAINMLYLLSFYFNYNSENSSLWWETLWIVFYVYPEVKFKNYMLNEIDSGLRPNYSLDFFAILVVSQVFSLYSYSWGNFVLMICPIVLVYKFGGYLYAWLFPV